jgi:hypothetical protein
MELSTVEVWTLEDAKAGKCRYADVDQPKTRLLDPGQDVYPPDGADVYDLPATLLKKYILGALHATYDQGRHHPRASGVDYFVWLRVYKPTEYVKMLQKFLPQTQVNLEAQAPVRFVLQTPIKSFDMVTENPEDLQKS